MRQLSCSSKACAQISDICHCPHRLRAISRKTAKSLSSVLMHMWLYRVVTIYRSIIFLSTKWHLIQKRMFQATLSHTEFQAPYLWAATSATRTTAQRRGLSWPPRDTSSGRWARLSKPSPRTCQCTTRAIRMCNARRIPIYSKRSRERGGMFPLATLTARHVWGLPFS